MKFFFGLTILVLFAVDNIESSAGEKEKLKIEKAEICKAELNATDVDVEEMLAGVRPTTKEAKCLHECLFSQLGVFHENKLVPEQFANLICNEEMSHIKGRDGRTLKELVIDIAKECEAVSDPDKCESTSQIFSCLDSEAQKYGFSQGALF